VAPLEALLKSGELSERQEQVARGVLERLKQPPASPAEKK